MTFHGCHKRAQSRWNLSPTCFSGLLQHLPWLHIWWASQWWDDIYAQIALWHRSQWVKMLPSAYKNQWRGLGLAKRQLWWHHRGAQWLGWGLFSLCILWGIVGGLGWRVCACAPGRHLRSPQLLKGYGTLSILNCSMKPNMKKRFAVFSEVSLLRILSVLSFGRAFLWRSNMQISHQCQ